MSLAPDEKSANGLGRAIAIAISLAVTAAFGFIAVYFIDWNSFVAAYAKISLTKLVILSALGLIPVLLRVLRLCVAIGQPVQWIFFRAVTIQGAAVATLPAKIGEAVLPLVLMRHAEYSLPRAVGVLLLLRLYDLLTLMVTGAVSLALLATDFGMAGWRPLLLLGAAATVGGMVLFPWLAALVSRQIRNYLNPEGKIVRLVDQLSFAARDLPKKRLAGLIAVSGCVWISLFLVFYLTGMIMDASPGPAASVLAGVAGALAFALPVNGLANLGPFEAAWAGVMIPLGVVPGHAIAAAVLSHFIQIFCNLALAGVGVLHWGLSGSSNKLI